MNIRYEIGNIIFDYPNKQREWFESNNDTLDTSLTKTIDAILSLVQQEIEKAIYTMERQNTYEDNESLVYKTTLSELRTNLRRSGLLPEEKA